MVNLQQKSNDGLGGRLWLLCFVIFSLLYFLTCQRGISWQDSGWIQMRIMTADYRGTANDAGDLGLALAHPLFIFMGCVIKNIPLGPVMLRLNLLSGIGMAAALANLAGIITILTKNRSAGIMTAAMLAVAHTAWWLATITEIYTWSAAGLTVEIYLLLLIIKKPQNILVVLLALVSGLGLSMHNFALLPLPVYLVTVFYMIFKRRISPWILFYAFIAYLAGASFFLGLIILEVMRTGDLAAVISSALFGNYGAQVANTSINWTHLKVNFALAALNFISILLPAATLGIFKIRKIAGRFEGTLLLAIFIIELLFFIRYPVPDQFTFILPTLIMLGILGGVGVAWCLSYGRIIRKITVGGCLISILLAGPVYGFLPKVIANSSLNIQRSRQLPYRNELRYWIVPWKNNETSAERFAFEALQQVQYDAVILTESTSHNPLLLAKLLSGQKTDVIIQGPHGPMVNFDKDPMEFFAQTFDKPLYTVTCSPMYFSQKLLKYVEAQKQEGQILYRLEWKKSLSFSDNKTDTEKDK